MRAERNEMKRAWAGTGNGICPDARASLLGHSTIPCPRHGQRFPLRARRAPDTAGGRGRSLPSRSQGRSAALTPRCPGRGCLSCRATRTHKQRRPHGTHAALGALTKAGLIRALMGCSGRRWRALLAAACGATRCCLWSHFCNPSPCFAAAAGNR